MKYLEVIKELTEDPTKKFEAKLSSRWTMRMSVNAAISRYFRFEVFYDNELIDQSSDRGAFNGNVALDDDWHPVPQPVTWQEAIEAWGNGRTIKKCFPNSEQTYPKESAIYLTNNDIKNAIWYVED